MFDILVFLFENYLPEACPEPEALARKLSAAGFGEDDISAALDWLSGLPPIDVRATAAIASGSHDALRIYDEEEIAKLSTEARGFLVFLEHAGGLDTALRETVVERAMALPETTVSLGKIKIIVLMVMWRREQALDTLLLEELLAEDDDERLCH
jgi:Smg protein